MIRLGKAFKGLGNAVSDNLPKLLTFAEIVGVCAVGYFSAKGALEANKRLAEYEASVGTVDISTKDKIKIAAPCYVPAVFAGLGTSLCFFYGHKVNAAKLTTALAATATAEKALADNREAIEEVFKKKGLQKVDTYINEKHMKEYLSSTKPVYETGHGNTLCCEAYLTGMMFRASPEWIYKCVNDFNAWINNGEDPSMNDFLSLLIPLLDPSMYPEVGEGFRMRLNPMTNKLNLMEIQLDSELTETGEPFLIFTQRNTMEYRNANL